MTARFIVGDTREVTASLADGSVDLLLSSPPFLSLRSYLPMDHLDKALEIGSESDPAAFIDVLLELTAEWRRVLAPHGSICVELGDTFSGSGGSGGDYADAGWRAGQERWGGSASRGRASQWSYPDALWLAGVLDTEGSIFVHHQQSDGRAPVFVPWVRVSMMDREICDRAALISGVGLVTQDKRRAYTWACSAQQARYVLTNLWPYLLIKQRQAKASIELSRHIDEEKRRGLYGRVSEEQIAYRMMIREYVTGLNGRGENRGVYVPTWEPPTPPRVSHAQIGGTGWPMSKSLALVPELYRIALAYGLNPLTGAPSPAGRWRVRNVVRWVRPNPPVGALGDKFRPATSDLVIACIASDRWFDLDAVRNMDGREPSVRAPEPKARAHEELGHHGKGMPATQEWHANGGAPPLDWWQIVPGGYSGKTSTTRQVPCGPLDGGQRTTSPDCPIHADLPGQLPKALRDAHAETSATDTPHNGARRVQGRPLADGANEQKSGHLDSSPFHKSQLSAQINAPAATPRGMESSRTDPDRLSSRPGTPSAETTGRIEHTSASLASDEHRLDTSANSISGPLLSHESDLGTPLHTADTASSDRSCTCTFTRSITESTSHYAVWPPALCEKPIESMCPRRVCRTCGKPSRRLTIGWSTCGCPSTDGLQLDGYHSGTGWRPGIVFDPFVGSGTTLVVAHGHSRDSIGIDIDERNAELAKQRLGMFLSVETTERVA